HRQGRGLGHVDAGWQDCLRSQPGDQRRVGGRRRDDEGDDQGEGRLRSQAQRDRHASIDVVSGFSRTVTRMLIKSFLWVTCATLTTLIVVCALASEVSRAQEPDPENIAAGMRIFRTKADCQACHGWAADGRKMDTQMPDGANLRTTKLNREKLIIAIKCGI